MKYTVTRVENAFKVEYRARFKDHTTFLATANEVIDLVSNAKQIIFRAHNDLMPVKTYAERNGIRHVWAHVRQ